MANTIKKSKSTVPGKKALAKKTTAQKPLSRARISVSKSAKIKTDDPLTKKILIEAASEGFSIAAAKTMKVMGYNVIVKDGWVVKKHADGRVEKISKLKSTHKRVSLD